MQNAQPHNAVILATPGLTTEMLYVGLSDHVHLVGVFMEQPESKLTVLKRRRKNVGVWQTLGQLFFMALVFPFIPNRKKRIEAIVSENGFAEKKIPAHKIINVKTVDDLNAIGQINALKPSVIFINGTRILRKSFLDAMPCPVVNIHVGITPKYRGVHGGYWALRQGEPHLFGVTLHVVDKGIDTGHIIAQKIIEPTETDNFKTYPILQYCAGVNLAIEHLPALLERKFLPLSALTNVSKLHYHPSIWVYLMGKTP